MTRVLVAVPGPHGDRLAAELAAAGLEARTGDVLGVEPGDPQASLRDVDVLVLAVSRATLTPALLSACDREGVRIVPVAAHADDTAAAAAAGLGEALPLDEPGWQVADAIASPGTRPGARHAPAAPARGRVIVVWGPAGAPGRSTVAVALAAELARGGHRVGLVDADSHAPSLALALGLADEGPGFAAACRQAERGDLDPAELDRISTRLRLDDGSVDVLTGINRPSRWPELSQSRVGAALDVCRDWAEYTVVDVAASLERDEEIVSDLDGPRRNAAALGALRAADLVVAVLSADPLGASRFVRGHAELHATIGVTPVAVAANRLRPGALGIDPRGQVRRTLDRFAGIPDVSFLPLDPRSADAAMLSARPISEVAPRSPFTLAVRRLAATALGMLQGPASPSAAPPESASVVPLPRRVSRRRPGVASRRRTA